MKLNKVAHNRGKITEIIMNAINLQICLCDVIYLLVLNFIPVSETEMSFSVQPPLYTLVIWVNCTGIIPVSYWYYL
jgi:hypothetical protein